MPFFWYARYGAGLTDWGTRHEPALMSYETLRVIWWLILGVLLMGFAITDGFDLGLGASFTFLGRTDAERRALLSSVEPVWEGNQVWFILGGGSAFAAWPLLYATSFSSLYLAMFLVLVALILRPVGFAYRDKLTDARWRRGWDIALTLGGALPALLFGLACGTIGFALYAVAPTGLWFWAMMPVAALWGVASPAAQAIMTHHVDPREQGRLQGAVASLSSVAGIIAPTLFTRLFASVTQANLQGAYAGATFWLASLMVGSALVLAWYTVSHLPAAIPAAPPPPAADLTSEILASASDLQPPIDETETRA